MLLALAVAISLPVWLLAEEMLRLRARRPVVRAKRTATHVHQAPDVPLSQTA
jgi:hypothetical protein